MDISHTKRLSLTYTRKKEPRGWPLTRPATKSEWSHVLKVMIMRRIPKHGPIHRTRLYNYVAADLLAASSAGRIYVDSDFLNMRMTHSTLKMMRDRDGIVSIAPRMRHPQQKYPAPAVYRTQFAENWIGRIPATVRAVVDFLPVTHALDMMVQAMYDDDPEPSSDIS